MIITLNTQLRHGRSGVEARSPELRLTSHASDEKGAIESLKKGIAAWCLGLDSRGELEKYLKQKHVKWQNDNGPITIEMNSTCLT